jgi:hypothetical protein
MTSEQGRLGTGTGKELHVLCYQHHTEMLLRPQGEPATGWVHVCREVGCLVGYDTSTGYFIDAKDAEATEQERTPRVTCPTDGQFMYLAEVIAARKNFRLWKCPECDQSRTNEETSGGLGKKMGA